MKQGVIKDVINSSSICIHRSSMNTTSGKNSVEQEVAALFEVFRLHSLLILDLYFETFKKLRVHILLEVYEEGDAMINSVPPLEPRVYSRPQKQL